MPRNFGEVPYWLSWRKVYGARMGSTVFAAANLAYVVRVYGADGSWADSIFTPPPSWKQARRPERGEFAGATTGEIRAYFSTFNVITGLAAVSEGVLIVTHGHLVDVSDDLAGRLEQVLGGRHARPKLKFASERVNVYADGRRLVTDAPTPGEILGYGPGRVVFGQRIAGRTGYILTEYAWRPSP